jgi:hypothetical protein
MAGMPSCEFPAIRITASEIFETVGWPPADVATAASLIDAPVKKFAAESPGWTAQPGWFQGEVFSCASYRAAPAGQESGYITNANPNQKQN